MRYLRKFNENMNGNLFEEIEQNVRDICLELDDNGVHKNFMFWRSKFGAVDWNIRVNITSKLSHGVPPFQSKTFKYTQIEDVIERLIDYLTPYQFKHKIIALVGDDYEYQEPVENIVTDDISEYEIRFYS